MRISKVFIAAFIQFCFLCSLIAQERDTFKVRKAFAHDRNCSIGVLTGAGITKLYGRNSNTNLDLSVSAGAYFQYRFTKIISIRAGLNYDRKGDRENAVIVDQFGNPFGTVPAQVYLNYITTTFLVQALLTEKSIFYINAGPYGSILAKSIFKQSASPVFGLPASTTDITSDTRKIDLGLTLGLGVNIPLSDNFILNVEARNNVGFIKVFSAGSLTYSAVLLVGFNYSFGKRKGPPSTSPQF